MTTAVKEHLLDMIGLLSGELTTAAVVCRKLVQDQDKVPAWERDS